jgi:hypothetical protein
VRITTRISGSISSNFGSNTKARIAVHFQVQCGVVRQIGLGQLQAFLGGASSAYAKTTAGPGAGHDAGEGGVVIDQQQMRQFFAFDLGFVIHVGLLGRHGAGAAR